MDGKEEELGIVPVDEYSAVFPFPTTTEDDASVVSSHEGFWVTWYVEPARADSGQGSGANKLTYGRCLSPWSVKERVKVFVSTPPPGLFSQRDVFWQEVRWPYDKDHAKWLQALIPATRLEDFRRGVQLDANTEFVVRKSVKKRRDGGKLYVNTVFWHCCCGPEDHTIDAAEKFDMLLKGKERRVSRKVGCPCRFSSSGFTESFKFMTCDGKTPLDTNLVRIRWPRDARGSPVWHEKHDVVPSWPASTETKRALIELVKQNDALTDAQILRRWRERIANYVQNAHGMKRNDLYTHLARRNIKFPREYYISVHDVKRVRQRSQQAVWRRNKNEIVSLLEAIMADEGIAVTRFRNMEIAPARHQGRLIIDDEFDEPPSRSQLDCQLDCAWCHFKADTADCLRDHMTSCPNGLRRGEYADAKYVESYVRSCQDGTPLATYEPEGNTESAWWGTTSSFISAKLRVLYDYMANNFESCVLSPQKEARDSPKADGEDLQRALVVFDGDGGDDFETTGTVELNEFLQACRENRSMDRALSTTQIATVDGVLEAKEFLDRHVSQGPSHARYCPVTLRDIQTLKFSNWLNDAVINWQLQFLNDLAHEEMDMRGEDVPRVHFFTTATLYEMSLKKWIVAGEKADKSSGVKLNFQAASYYEYDHVKKHLRKKTYDCMECEYLFFPVHWPGHWAACIVSVKSREVYYLDSMGVCDEGHRGAHIAEDVVRLMCDAYRERNETLSPGNWTVMQKNKLRWDVPLQLNSYDCGMFMLSFARHLLDHGIDNKPLSKYKFRTEHMAHRRRVVAYEILTVGVHDAVKDADTVDGDIAQVPVFTDMQDDDSIHDENFMKLIEELEQTLSRECGVDVRSNRTGEFYNCPASRLPRIRVSGELWVVVKPFCLILMTATQASWMWRYGHGNGVQMDSTFGTNKARYSLFTLVVRHDVSGIGLPGAWVIVSDERTETIAYCLGSIRETLRSSRPEKVTEEWTPSAFMVDCALSELAAVRQIFGATMSTFWCHWHVMQAMQKRALRVSKEYRRYVKDRALSLVRFEVKNNIKQGVLEFYQMLSTFTEYCRNHGDNSVVEYGNYFARQWVPRVSLWAKVFRTGMKYGIDTTSTAESYHNFLKQLAKDENNSRWIKQRRMDWLCHFLVDVALPEFVQREHVNQIKLPERVRKAYKTKLQEYGKLTESGELHFKVDNPSMVYCDVEKCEILESIHVHVTESGDHCSVHEVANLHMLQTSALQKHHQLITCSCPDGTNDKLCFGKLHAMIETNKGYTLAALDLDANVDHKSDLHARRDDARRMSQDDVWKLTQSANGSGTGKMKNVSVKPITVAQLDEICRRAQRLASLRNVSLQRQAYNAMNSALQLVEDGLEQERVTSGGEPTIAPTSDNTTSMSGVQISASHFPHIEHNNRSQKNPDTLQRGKSVLERARRRSRSSVDISRAQKRR